MEIFYCACGCNTEGSTARSPHAQTAKTKSIADATKQRYGATKQRRIEATKQRRVGPIRNNAALSWYKETKSPSSNLAGRAST